MPSLLPFVIIGVILFGPCDLRAENSQPRGRSLGSNGPDPCRAVPHGCPAW